MATPKAAPKYLIQKFPRKGIGRLFLRTDALASRADMFPYVGPVPASMQVKLDADTGVVTAVVAAADSHANALQEEKVADTTGKLAEEEVVDLTPTYTPEEKHAKLVAEIGKMNPQNEEHYTKDGRPKIDHLMLALGGVDVSSPERDAAFAEHQKKSKAKK